MTRRYRQRRSGRIVGFRRRRDGRTYPVFAAGSPETRPVLPPGVRSEGIRRQRFMFHTVREFKPESGSYRFYGENGELLYIGSTEDIRRRMIDDYYGRGDMRLVPDKGKLLAEIAKVDVDYMPIDQARLFEKRLKSHAKFNIR